MLVLSHGTGTTAPPARRTGDQNPAGTGHHIHAWQWGDPLDQGLLRDAALSAGMGDFAEVHPRRAPAGAALTYGMKTVIDGSPVGTELPDATWDYLRLNGGRLLHATRGFWRDETGQQLGEVRDALRAVARLNGGDDTWVLTTAAVGP